MFTALELLKHLRAIFPLMILGSIKLPLHDRNGKYPFNWSSLIFTFRQQNNVYTYTITLTFKPGFLTFFMYYRHMASIAMVSIEWNHIVKVLPSAFFSSINQGIAIVLLSYVIYTVSCIQSLWIWVVQFIYLIAIFAQIFRPTFRIIFSIIEANTFYYL